MPRKGSRHRVATNIYDDLTGRVIIYRDRAGKQREIRRAKGTPITAMRAAVEDALKAEGTVVPFAHPGTLGDGCNELEQIEGGMAGWTERRSELRAWCKAEWRGAQLSDLAMSAITDKIARAVMNQWTAAGVAPKTIRQRLWTLKHLYRVLGGPKVATPVDDIAPPPKVRLVPVVIEAKRILAVYHALREQERRGILRDAKTRARFMVRAATGRRPAEIMRAKPEDVNLARREWRVRDAKGGWSPGVYLNDDMLAAWQTFIAADAWGSFNTGSMARVLRTAGWQPGVRPYELRHNVAIAMTDAGLPLDAASAQLGHKDLHTTRRTYAPIRASHMQRASEAIEGRFAGWRASKVPVASAAKRGNLRKSMGSTNAVGSSMKRRKSQGKLGRKAGGSA